MYCADRFETLNTLERHQNPLHLGKYSWSCVALKNDLYNLIYAPKSIQLPDNNLWQSQSLSTSSTAFDVCGYCGTQFPKEPAPDWEARVAHLIGVHKYDECNQDKKFFHIDHFREHLKHCHAGTSGKWMNKLEVAGMRDEPPPVPNDNNGQQSQGASVANMNMGASNMGPIRSHEDIKCLFCGEKNLRVEGSRRRHIERHMEEVSFAVVSKPYEEWDFYSDSSSKHSSDIDAEGIFSSNEFRHGL